MGAFCALLDHQTRQPCWKNLVDSSSDIHLIALFELSRCFVTMF